MNKNQKPFLSDVDKILILMTGNKERERDLILRSEAPSFKSKVKNRDNPEFDDDFIYKGNGFFIKKKDYSAQPPTFFFFFFAIRNMKLLI